MKYKLYNLADYHAPYVDHINTFLDTHNVVSIDIKNNYAIITYLEGEKGEDNNGN